jgi:hypothetical protein
MIVHPDFLDHWKTRRLVELTGDESAPLMMLRLWGYCQIQKQSSFENLSADVLASVCRAKIGGEKLLKILIECRFVRQDGDTLIIHDWERSNRILRNAWDNGQKGGHYSKFKRPTGSRHAIRRHSTGNPPRALEEKKRIETGGCPQAEEEKPNPVNIEKFGRLLGDLSKQMKGDT